MKQEDLLLDFTDSVGQFMHYWGFKSIHGRVWALIYLSDEAISTPKIVSTLGVSKGLVSHAIGDLLEYNLILPSDKVVYGAQTYITSERVADTVKNILKERELESLIKTEAALKALKKETKASLKEKNISDKKIEEILELTTYHKKILSYVVKKKFISINDWIGFLKKIIRWIR